MLSRDPFMLLSLYDSNPLLRTFHVVQLFLSLVFLALHCKAAQKVLSKFSESYTNTA